MGFPSTSIAEHRRLSLKIQVTAAEIHGASTVRLRVVKTISSADVHLPFISREGSVIGLDLECTRSFVIKYSPSIPGLFELHLEQKHALLGLKSQ